MKVRGGQGAPGFAPLTLSTGLALALYSSEKFWLKKFHARLVSRVLSTAGMYNIASKPVLARLANDRATLHISLVPCITDAGCPFN